MRNKQKNIIDKKKNVDRKKPKNVYTREKA